MNPPLTRQRGISVSIRDVAAQAVVSVSTVSRVLNNHPDVKPELRLRVLAVADELGYSLPVRKPNDPGSNGLLYTNTENNQAAPTITHIAFCGRPAVTDGANPYFSQMLRGVEAECNRYNLHLIYRMMQDTPGEL